MKLIFSFFSFFLMLSCIGQNKKPDLIITNDIKTTDKESPLVPDDAFQMNMGFTDNPKWVWVKFDHFLSNNDFIYNHIYGLNFWEADGQIKTLYYERDRELNDSLNIVFNNYIINPKPGDKTLELVGKAGDTLLLFNVLENKSLRSNFKGKEYQRISTVNFNNKKEKVSDYDVRIYYTLKKKPFYEVILISDNGINTQIFKSNCDLNDNFNISYYDLTNNRIYLLQKDCYLEKVDL